MTCNRFKPQTKKPTQNKLNKNSNQTISQRRATRKISSQTNVPNDALAVDIMRQNDVTEIYFFDEHFNRVEGINRLPTI